MAKGKSKTKDAPAAAPKPTAHGGPATVTATLSRDEPWPADVRFVTENVWSPDVPESTFRRYLPSGPRNPPDGQASGRNKNAKPRRITDPSHPAFGQFGLFAARKLPAKSHIIDYVGYVTPEGKESPSSDYTLRLGDLVVDAAEVGNEARMINDYRGTGTPRPTARFDERTDEHGNTRMAVFVAERDLPKGAEILVSYGKGYWSERGIVHAAAAFDYGGGMDYTDDATGVAGGGDDATGVSGGGGDDATGVAGGGDNATGVAGGGDNATGVAGGGDNATGVAGGV